MGERPNFELPFEPAREAKSRQLEEQRSPQEFSHRDCVTNLRGCYRVRLPSSVLRGFLALIVPLESPISFSFTAASLRPELVRLVAGAFLANGTWEAAKNQVLKANSLQARSPRSAKRLEGELRIRLRRLTPAQIHLAAAGNAEERVAIAWLAALKASSFIHGFASEVLRGKLSSLDPILRASDYETFFEDQGAIHPGIHSLTPSSRAKVRTVLLTMLREAGIAHRDGRNLRIQRPVISPAVLGAIVDDSPKWLAGFLVPDTEIPAN